MEYLEIQIENVVPESSERLTAELLEAGFDSFSEEEGKFSAYIPARDYNENRLKELLGTVLGFDSARFSVTPLEDKNWNEEWEKNYPPVIIGEQCLVRAPFHEPVAGIKYDLVIEPKMSFGTAHHETTALMIGWMLDEPVTGKHVLDMGCGTGILAILAAKQGAKEVRAIDNDEWAFGNAKENILRNNVPQVHVIQGDDGAIPWGPFDVIVANINRNILLKQIPVYSRVMSAGGTLYLSGFYQADLEAIGEKAKESGFDYMTSREKNGWLAVKFVK
jgi:ribosomal protein L11 methyltransferase